jgi:hypothetical protein
MKACLHLFSDDMLEPLCDGGSGAAAAQRGADAPLAIVNQPTPMAPAQHQVSPLLMHEWDHSWLYLGGLWVPLLDVHALLGHSTGLLRGVGTNTHAPRPLPWGAGPGSGGGSVPRGSAPVRLLGHKSKAVLDAYQAAPTPLQGALRTAARATSKVFKASKDIFFPAAGKIHQSKAIFGVRWHAWALD